MQPGATLGPYRIEREIGSGGMGKVYAATVTRASPGLTLGQTVALKVVHPHLLETEGFFKRFLREGQVGRAVRHDNVVRTLDCDALDAHHFLVMEYVEGQTLGELLGELERVPEELCRHVAREICKGLTAIHAAGAVHRDLKPENVLITPDHQVKVMDLGVARLVDQQLRLSQSGAFIGSVEYAAPEQFGGKAVDHRCDLHALGVVLYELSSGRHPYRGDDFRGVMKRVCEEEPRRLGDLEPQLSAFFEEVVHKLLAKDRDDRFTSAAELLAILQDGEASRWWQERARAIRTATDRPVRRIRIPRETAVYGRDAELARLQGLFDRAAAGDGQVVLIEGEAGIGKSRLVDELVVRLTARGDDPSFLFGSYPPGGAASASGAFSAAFREYLGADGSARYLTRTPRLAPAFDAVLRGEPPPRDVGPLSAEALGTCFVHCTRSLAAERPTIVLIDDLHFAPEEARDLFTALALAVPGHRVLLVGTLRPGVPESWIANVSRFEHSTHLELSRLGPKDLALLLNETFRSEHLAHQLGHRIALKSDGNPFFAFEIIRGLREGQFITQSADGSWVSTRVIEEIEIPSSLVDLVNARVSDLSEDQRNLLDVAACWGYEFDPTLVGAVLGIPRIPLLRELAQIERRHRLVRAAGRSYLFDHHQVQEALYGSLSELLREEYHAALADALERREDALSREPAALDGALCADLCEHFLAGAQGRRALRYLRCAQRHLDAHYQSAQLVSLTERVLAVPGLLTGTERAEALLGMDSALALLGRRDRRVEANREADRLAEEAGDEALRSRALQSLATHLSSNPEAGDAEAVYQSAREHAEKAGFTIGVVNAMRGVETLLSREGRFVELEERARERIRLARAIGFEHGTGSIGLAHAYFGQGRFDEAKEEYATAARLFRRLGDRRNEATAALNVGNVAYQQECHTEAESACARALELARESGDRRTEAGALGNLAGVRFAQGRLGQAEALYRRRIALDQETGFLNGEANALIGLGLALEERGETSEADGCLARSIEISERTQNRYLAAWASMALGALRMTASQGRDGCEWLHAALDRATEDGRTDLAVLSACELAAWRAGDAEAALAAFADCRDRLPSATRRHVHLLLWKATGDREHLDRAKELLDQLLERNPAEHRRSICECLMINREILAAWRAAGRDR